MAKTAPRSSVKERALEALLEHTTREKAAAAIGVHPTTLWRWLKNPDFQQALREARREAFWQSVGRLQQASPMAVETLLAILTDPEAPAGGRVRAAQAILDRAHKSFALEDLEVRIAQLEQRQRDGEPAKEN